MFFRVFALLPLALLASASHLVARNQCNTGSIQCCTTQPASQSSSILEPYGLVSVLSGNSLIGTACSASGVASVGGGCTGQQEPVCCQGNTFDGLVSIGCTPINVNV